MFLAIKEKQFVKRVVKRLLVSYSAVGADNAGISDRALYREVILHSQLVDPSRVDRILRQAEDSVDLWTTSTGAVERMEFRQVVHFIVLSLYREDGHAGTIVSFRDIVYSLIPSEL